MVCGASHSLMSNKAAELTCVYYRYTRYVCPHRQTTTHYICIPDKWVVLIPVTNDGSDKASEAHAGVFITANFANASLLHLFGPYSSPVLGYVSVPFCAILWVYFVLFMLFLSFSTLLAHVRKLRLQVVRSTFLVQLKHVLKVNQYSENQVTTINGHDLQWIIS
jgi:hypothetical protein